MMLGSILRGVQQSAGLSPGKPFQVRDVLTAKTLFGWPPPEPSRETAWLDGLRGVAAFLVMIYHYNLTFWNPMVFEAPYGASNFVDGKPTGEKFLQLWRVPFLRIWMDSGHTQVSIFFVLSGFVLSWGPIAYIRSGQHDKLSRSLGSATFRRWIRLFLPCFAIAFWECLEVWSGLRKMPKERMNLLAQIWDYLKDCEKFANPFQINRDGWNSLHGYDFTMWTIPMEFAGSLLVFAVLLAVGRIRNFGKRSLVMLAVVVWAALRAEWYFWLFSSGMLLANYVRQRGGFQQLSEKSSRREKLIWIAVFVASLLLAGLPEKSEMYNRPGYDWLVSLTPHQWMEAEGGGRFWWCWAGIGFVTSACHLATVRRVYELSFMRYLGRVSFMLYLTHRVVLNLLGDPVHRLVYGLFGRITFINVYADGTVAGNTPVTLLIYIILLGILLPIALMVAHWCEVLIDAPSTRLARRVDDWFTKGPELPDGIELSTPRVTEQILQPRREPLEREDTSLLTTHEVELTSLPPSPHLEEEKNLDNAGNMV